MNNTNPPSGDEMAAQIAQLASSLRSVEQRLDQSNHSASDGLTVIISSLIFFMQAGFAFLETGAVRPGKEKPILFKNFLVLCVSTLSFWAIGYALGYGDGNSFIGTTFFFLSGFGNAEGIHYSDWLSSFVYAATTSTVATGAMAERAKLVSYLLLSFFVAGFIHPVVTHWAWKEGGWLHRGIDVDNTTITYTDFAGSGVVHVTGGTVAFLGAAILGPRLGRFDESGKPIPLKLKNAAMSALGGFILFLGFLLFLCRRDHNAFYVDVELAFGRAQVNTLVASSGAALTSLILFSILNARKSSSTIGRSQLLTTLNGGLAGLVAICAGARTVHSYIAFIIGIVAGLSYIGWSKLILRWGIDDPVESISVHLGAGIWGVIAEGLFSTEHGLLYKWTRVSIVFLMWNVLAVVAIFAWTAAMSALLFGIMHAFNLLRLSSEDELGGTTGKKSRISFSDIPIIRRLNRRIRLSTTATTISNPDGENENQDVFDGEDKGQDATTV
ncbi:putative ammonium transporter 1 [Oscarella lobularis]|uniref:putative ammonium transporter 1 n=1 Tax=Oscarella lobularis TaxID=121494 RepID=UPI003313FEB0